MIYFGESPYAPMASHDAICTCLGEKEQTPLLPGKATVSAEPLTASRRFWPYTGGGDLEKAAGAVKQRLPACQRRQAPWRAPHAVKVAITRPAHSVGPRCGDHRQALEKS